MRKERKKLEICRKGLHKLEGENVGTRMKGGKPSRFCVPCNAAWWGKFLYEAPALAEEPEPQRRSHFPVDPLRGFTREWSLPYTSAAALVAEEAR
jgi:hypothetical protein